MDDPVVAAASTAGDDDDGPATPPSQSSSSLKDFFEKTYGSNINRTKSGVSSSKEVASSNGSGDNWANFELVTISASSTISFDNHHRHNPTGNNNSDSCTISSTSFVVFESSWHAFLLGGSGDSSCHHQVFSNNVSTTVSSVPFDDDDGDGWMSQLLPLRYQCQQQQRPPQRRKIPPLQRNPRDCTVHHRFHAGLMDPTTNSTTTTTTSHYHHYQAAYVANAGGNWIHSSSDSGGPSFFGDHHLSNEEWIAQRRRRDGRLRRRYQQEVEHMLGLEQVVVTSPPPSGSLSPSAAAATPGSDLDQQQRFVRRIVADGQTLLSNHDSPSVQSDASENSDNSSSGNLESGVAPTTTTMEEATTTTVRPSHRFHPRRPHRTSQARREQFQHWSSSAVQRSLDMMLVPWRMVFRNDDNDEDPAVVAAAAAVTVESSDNSQNIMTEIAVADQSFSDDMSGRAISSEANSSMSHGEEYYDENTNSMSPWPSGRGWRVGQDEDNSRFDENGGDSDDSTGGTGYWSTGTAMETDYETSSCGDGSSFTSHHHHQQEQDDGRQATTEWVDGLTGFPSVEEEDPHQYEFMPTPEDPLFPEDPFSEHF